MRKGKRFKKEKKDYIKIIRIIFIILLIISVIYIVNAFLHSKKEDEETQELLDSVSIIDIPEMVDESEERVLKVKELKAQYPDVVGWLEIKGTNINYPVMQGEDNDYYMDHNYKKEETKSGSIFLDKNYDWSIPSSNLLMYGHNKRSASTMFSDLLQYKEERFYQSYPTIRFTTPEEDAEYEIIAAFLSRVYYKSEKNVFRYYFFVNAKNELEYNDFVTNAKKASLYETGKTAEYGDQLMTLSTCEYSQEDGRFAVVARKVNIHQ